MAIPSRIWFFLLAATAMSASAQQTPCPPGTAVAALGLNNAEAILANNGLLGPIDDGYEVPRNSGIRALGVGELWIAGRVGGALRGSADFRPGPASRDPEARCSDVDRIYRVEPRDLSALDRGEVPSKDVLEWPWELGAPVVDGDGVAGNYNLAGGDRPEMLGSGSLFWILTDLHADRRRVQTEPLSVEVHVTAFSARSDNPDVDNSIFYRVRVLNRSAVSFDSLYAGFGFWGGLGNWDDDYVGSDSLLGLGFVYNADNDDEDYVFRGDVRRRGYGFAPPASGLMVLRGPEGPDGLDNDHDGQIDEDGEHLGATSMVRSYLTCGIAGCGPLAPKWYNILRGLHDRGDPYTRGYFGRELVTGLSTTRFLFDGHPPGFWSQMTPWPGEPPHRPDSHGLKIGVGPVHLEPDDSAEYLLAAIWARGADHLDSVDELKAVAGRLHALEAEKLTGGTSAWAPTSKPEILAPGNGAVEQSVQTQLVWDLPEHGRPELGYQVDLRKHGQELDYWQHETAATRMDLVFEPEASYSFRVRAFTHAAYGPWSEWSRFWTGDNDLDRIEGFVDFTVVQNAAGPLVPHEGAAPDWAGFPGTAPTDRQQTNGRRWVITSRTADEYRHFISRVARNGWGRVLPYSFELRFSGESWMLRNNSLVLGGMAPLEAWNIGYGTPADTTDDYRMIISYSDEGRSGWGMLDSDHRIGEGPGDRPSDRFSIWDPADRTPGESGYQKWVEASLAYDEESELGERVLRDLVLVDIGTDGGFSGPPVLPEPGTVFRIATAPTPSPRNAAPSPGAHVLHGPVQFYWTGVQFKEYHVVVSEDDRFTRIAQRTDVASSGVMVDLPAGSYHWRVEDEDGNHSPQWSLFIDSATGTVVETPGHAFELQTPYPNPTQGTASIRYTLPEVAHVRLEIFDVLGRRVRGLIDAVLPQGPGEAVLDTAGLGSGVYLVRLVSARGSLTRLFSIQ